MQMISDEVTIAATHRQVCLLYEQCRMTSRIRIIHAPKDTERAHD